MQRRSTILFSALTIFLCTLCACEKEGEIIVNPIKEFKPYSIQGFALGKLDQYFDGVKVRELYGNMPSGIEAIAFEKEEISMELKNKANGQTIYQQLFNISSDTNKVPKFYFDGEKMHDTYTYPDVQGKEYLANFYFDFPKDSTAVDIVIELVEYYYDWNLNDPTVIIDTTTIPLFSNIKPGKWSEYMPLNPIPPQTKHNPESEFQPYICVKKAGKDAYYIGSTQTENTFQLELPYDWTTQGKVQSIFVGWTQKGSVVSLMPQQNLVALFPK